MREGGGVRERREGERSKVLFLGFVQVGLLSQAIIPQSTSPHLIVQFLQQE